jgi:hypothetical protein
MLSKLLHIYSLSYMRYISYFQMNLENTDFNMYFVILFAESTCSVFLIVLMIFCNGRRSWQNKYPQQALPLATAVRRYKGASYVGCISEYLNTICVQRKLLRCSFDSFLSHSLKRFENKVKIKTNKTFYTQG